MEIGILLSSYPPEGGRRDPQAKPRDQWTGSERLEDTVRKQGYSCRRLYEPLFTFVAEGSEMHVWYDGEPYQPCDILIYRPNFHEEPSLHQHVLEALQRIHQPMLNGAFAANDIKNKIWQHLRLAEAKLPMPRWAVAKSSEAAFCAADHLQFPLIVKVAFGTHGKGVFFVENRKTLAPIVDYLGIRDGNPVIMEEFIAAAEHRDIRVFVVGGRVVAAMQRTARTHDIRANAALGGTGSPIDLTAEEERLAVLAAGVFSLDIAGVDLIRSEKGPLILEVNAYPGFRELESCTGIDVAGAIIEEAVRKVG